MLLTKKHYFIIFGGIFIVIIAVLLVLYFLGGEAPEPETQPVQEQSPLGEYSPEKMEPGQIGEVLGSPELATGERLLPKYIFSTKGTILEMGQDYIMIAGNGSNFEDEQPRQLKCLVSDYTKVFVKNEPVQQGKSSLNLLKGGIAVSVSSLENIRGKTEFALQTIKEL